MDANTAAEGHVNGMLSNGDLAKEENQPDCKVTDSEGSCSKLKDSIGIKLTQNGKDFHADIEVKLGQTDRDDKVENELKVKTVCADLPDTEKPLMNGEVIGDVKELEKSRIASEDENRKKVCAEECNQEKSTEGEIVGEDPPMSAISAGSSVDQVTSREGSPTRILPSRTQTKTVSMSTRQASVDPVVKTAKHEATPTRKDSETAEREDAPKVDSLGLSRERDPTKTLVPRESRTRSTSTESQAEASSREKTPGQRSSLAPRSRCSTREGTPTRNSSTEAIARESGQLRDSSSENSVSVPCLLEHIEKIKKPRRGSRSDILPNSVDTHGKSTVDATVDTEKLSNTLEMVGGERECVQESKRDQEMGPLLNKQAKENISSHLNRTDPKPEAAEVSLVISGNKTLDMSSLDTSEVGSVSTPAEILVSPERKKRKYTRRISVNKPGEKSGKSPKKAAGKKAPVARKRVLNKSIDSCVENPKKRRNYTAKKLVDQSDALQKQPKRRSLPLKVVVAKDPEFQNSQGDKPKVKRKYTYKVKKTVESDVKSGLAKPSPKKGPKTKKMHLSDYGTNPMNVKRRRKNQPKGGADKPKGKGARSPFMVKNVCPLAEEPSASSLNVTIAQLHARLNPEAPLVQSAGVTHQEEARRLSLSQSAGSHLGKGTGLRVKARKKVPIKRKTTTKDEPLGVGWKPKSGPNKKMTDKLVIRLGQKQNKAAVKTVDKLTIKRAKMPGKKTISQFHIKKPEIPVASATPSKGMQNNAGHPEDLNIFASQRVKSPLEAVNMSLNSPDIQSKLKGMRGPRAKMSPSPSRYVSTSIVDYFKPSPEAKQRGPAGARKTLAYTKSGPKRKQGQDDAATAPLSRKPKQTCVMSSPPFRDGSVDQDSVYNSSFASNPSRSIQHTTPSSKKDIVNGTSLNEDSSVPGLKGQPLISGACPSSSNEGELHPAGQSSILTPVRTPTARKTFPRSRESTPVESLIKSEPLNSPLGGIYMAKGCVSTAGDGKNSMPHHARFANMTIKLGELENALGIKRKSLDKLDAKTLDKIVLEKAQKMKARKTMGSSTTGPRHGLQHKAVVLGHTLEIGPEGQKNQDDGDHTQIMEKPQFHLPDGGEHVLEGDVERRLVDQSTHFSAMLAGQKLLKKRRKKRRGTYKLPKANGKPPKLYPRTTKTQQKATFDEPKMDSSDVTRIQREAAEDSSSGVGIETSRFYSKVAQSDDDSNQHSKTDNQSVASQDKMWEESVDDWQAEQSWYQDTEEEGEQQTAPTNEGDLAKTEDQQPNTGSATQADSGKRGPRKKKRKGNCWARGKVPRLSKNKKPSFTSRRARYQVTQQRDSLLDSQSLTSLAEAPKPEVDKSLPPRSDLPEMPALVSANGMSLDALAPDTQPETLTVQPAKPSRKRKASDDEDDLCSVDDEDMLPWQQVLPEKKRKKPRSQPRASGAKGRKRQHLDREAGSASAYSEIPSLSPAPAGQVLSGDASGTMPSISPQTTVTGSSMLKQSNRLRGSQWDDLIYVHPLSSVMRKNKRQTSSATSASAASSASSSSASSSTASVAKNCPALQQEDDRPFRYVNTPNGITYPVTPPRTPEHGRSDDERSANGVGHPAVFNKDKDFVPLCTCRIAGASFKNVNRVLYCQALDSIDGKIVGCVNKVSNPQLVRPAVKIPFMAVCEVHRQRLRLHQCCPSCGHFCTQGKFFQCKKEANGSLHHFHRQCQVFRDNKYYCPHCGEESPQFQVALQLNEVRQRALAFVKDEKKQLGSKAKMCSENNVKDEASEAIVMTTTTAVTEREISTADLPLGPDRADLECAIALLSGEKPKKLRVGPKSLYVASRTGEVDRVLFMLVEGTDPSVRFEEEANRTALHAAAESGYFLITHLLLQAGASPHAVDDALYTPIMVAADQGHLAVLKLLVKAGALVDFKGSDGMTSLHLAAKAGHVEAVKFLLETGKIDVNVKDEGGWTAVIWAAEHRHIAVVKYLLESGSDPNLRDNEENTGLHWAAFSGSLDIAEIFLNAGCDLESVNEHGDRPLHIAARQDHYECVVLCLARGADSESRNNNNEAAISCCLDQSSPVWMALRVNRQLQGFASRMLQPPERLLHRDISFGRETNAVPVVNSIDEDNYPEDFLYVTDYVETAPMNVNRLITSLQSCQCRDSCASAFCNCSRNSIKCWYEKDGRLTRDFSFTEPPLIFECNKACRCWTSCSNRVIQLGITCRLQVFRTDLRGWGVRTLLDIPQGSFVCEYIGELISDADADSREDDSYLFDLDNKDSDTYCIDARRYGNISRFINHLCEPNLTPVKVFVDHQDLRFPRICFFANRDIKAYDELGFDYGDKFWIIKWKQFTCGCGSPKCRYSQDSIHKTIQDYNKRQQEEEIGDAEPEMQ